MNAKFNELASGRVVNVSLPHQTFNLDQVQKITANLMKQLGHAGCYSGFDIRFRHEDDFRVNPATLEVNAFHG